MCRKTTKSKPILVLGANELKLMPLLGSKARAKEAPKKFKKNGDKKLRELCSKYKVENKEAFIKALYEEVGLREYLFRSYTPKKQEQTRYLTKFKNQCRALLDTILEGRNIERGNILPVLGN